MPNVEHNLKLRAVEEHRFPVKLWAGTPTAGGARKKMHGGGGFECANQLTQQRKHPFSDKSGSAVFGQLQDDIPQGAFVNDHLPGGWVKESEKPGS